MNAAKTINHYGDDDDAGPYMHTRKKKDFNHGHKNVYPYFAPDEPFLRAAPKATQAEELLLRNFEKTNELIETANVDRAMMNAAKSKNFPQRDGRNVAINPRLRKERDTDDGKPLPKKKTITDRIFDVPNRMPLEKDTAEEEDSGDARGGMMGINDLTKNMAAELAFQNDWDPVANSKVVHVNDKNKGGEKGDPNSVADFSGIGNQRAIVPFFPTDWKGLSNDLFNEHYKIGDTEESEIDLRTG